MTLLERNASRRHLLLASGLAAAGLNADAASTSRPLDLKPQASRLRIAFGSCAKQGKPQPIWQAVSASRPDLFVFLGDNFYADTRDEATLRQRYQEFRAAKALQDFRRQTPHLAIWDDHDFGDDDVGADYELKRLSQQLFCDEWAEPADSPRRRRSGIYESYRFESGGRRVQLILLDLRFNRTALLADPALHQGYKAMVLKAKLTGQPMKGWYLPNPDPKASLLGQEQWDWLARQLAEPADLRIIGSSVQFAAEGTGWEGWANFPLERERLLQLIRKQRAEGVVFISGDMHYADISRWDMPAGYPLWDITSSGLTEVWDIPTPNLRRQSAVLAEQNFGLLDIDWAAGSVALVACDVQGRRRLQQVLKLADLRFKA